MSPSPKPSSGPSTASSSSSAAAASASSSSRAFDVVVLGATGYTGELVAAYLATRLRGTTTRWAIAGRNRAALEGIRSSIAGTDGADVPIIIADASSPRTLDALAQQTTVVLNCAGPFALYGLPVIAACVQAGTHYVDITGEPGYYANVIRKFHKAAAEKGVCIVPACGLDSLPVDLAVLDALFARETGPAAEIASVEAYMKLRIKPSQGTALSGLDALREMNLRTIHAMVTAWTGPITIRKILRSLGRMRSAASFRVRHLLPSAWFYSPLVRAWVFPAMPALDGAVARRSVNLLAKHVDRNFPTDFHLVHYLVVNVPLPALVLPLVLLVTMLFLPIITILAKFPPTYWLLRLLVRTLVPRGPNERTRQATSMELVVASRARTDDLRRLVYLTAVDPGYGTTAKWISECALALARGDYLHPLSWHTAASGPSASPLKGGVLTPASCFGIPLLDNLKARGLLRTTTAPASTQ